MNEMAAITVLVWLVCLGMGLSVLALGLFLLGYVIDTLLEMF